VTYYTHLVDLLTFASSPTMLRRRLRSTENRTVRWVHRIRTAGMRNNLTNYRGILSMLREDSSFRAFHEGRSTELPEFYQQRYARMLGRYSGLLSAADRVPDLDPA
jgi:hypothetical protein